MSLPPLTGTLSDYCASLYALFEPSHNNLGALAPPPMSPLSSLSGFWLDHVSFYEFVSLSLPSFSSVAASCPVFSRSVIDDNSFSTGYYRINSKAISSYDVISKAWTTDYLFSDSDSSTTVLPIKFVFFRIIS